MNTKELIEKIQLEVIETDLSPLRAGELLAQLSSLLGNVTEALATVEMAYNIKMAEILKENPVVAKARIIAQTTKEYENLLRIGGYERTVLEMIRSLKYLIKIKMEEYREIKYDNSHS